MASLAISVVGAVAGSVIPGVGWQIGWTVGSVLGGILFPPRLGPQGSGRLDDLRISGSAFGTPIPIVYGQMRVPGIIIWSPDLEETSSGGGKGGGKGKVPSQATYSSSFAAAFCEGEVSGIKRIWADDMLIYEDGELVDGFGAITIYLGDETQVADPLIEADKGVGLVSGHRGLCYVVFEEMPLAKFGNRRPNISAEIEGSELGFDEILRSSLESVYVKRADGSLWVGGTGTNLYTYNSITEVDSAIDIACGSKSSAPTGLYIDDTGQLYANGHNNSGSLAGVSVFGNGITTNTHTSGAWVTSHGGNDLPNLGTGNLDFASINSRAYLVKSDNTLWQWGDAGSGFAPAYSYRGDGSTTHSAVPVQVGSDTLQVSVGSMGVLRLKEDGTVEYTGQGGGWAGNNTTTNVTSWTASDITGVVRIAGNQDTAGSTHVSYAVKADGTLWACGSNHNNGLGDTALGSGDILVWTQVDVDGAFITDVRGCLAGACALDNSGQVWSWGEGESAGQGVTGSTQANPAVVISNVRAIGNTHNALFAITDTDDVYAWGQGDNYQRGDNSTTDLSTPTLMPWAATRQGETVQSVLEDISTRCGLDSSEYDFSACSDSQVTGYILSHRGEARGLIDPLIRCHFVDLYEADGKIYGEIRGGSSTHTIDEDDMQARMSNDEIPPFCVHERGNENELPARIDLSYFTAIRDYDEVTASSTRVTNPTALDFVTVQYPGTLSQTDGRQIAEALLYEQWVMRDKYNISLGSKHIGIIPSDRPLVPREPGATETLMKVAGADYSPFGLSHLQLHGYDPEVYTQVAEGATLEPSTSSLFELQTSQIFAFCAPAINDTDALDQRLGVYVAITAPAGRWDGATLSYGPSSLVGYVTPHTWRVRATCGLATTVLQPPNKECTALWDDNSVTINLVAGTLLSATRLEVLNGANRAYLGGEYIGFSTVTYLGGTTYQLSDLLRGQRGTDLNWDSHSVNDEFVLLDGNVIRFWPASDSTWYGLNIHLFANFSLLDGTDDEVAVEIDGSEVMPYTVCDVVGVRDGSNNLTITWKRRTRAGGEMVDLVDVPLSEFDERYRVDYYDVAETTILRTITVTSETEEYTAAEQTTDGLTPGDPVHLKITQLGKYKPDAYGFDVDGFSEIITI